MQGPRSNRSLIAFTESVREILISLRYGRWGHFVICHYFEFVPDGPGVNQLFQFACVIWFCFPDCSYVFSNDESRVLFPAYELHCMSFVSHGLFLLLGLAVLEEYVHKSTQKLMYDFTVSTSSSNLHWNISQSVHSKQPWRFQWHRLSLAISWSILVSVCMLWLLPSGALKHRWWLFHTLQVQYKSETGAEGFPGASFTAAIVLSLLIGTVE